MNENRRSPVSGQLTAATALVAAGFLLALGIIIVLYGTRYYVLQETRNTGIQARILASTVTAALAFDDPAAGREYVNALKASPAVQVAALYDAAGKSFVAYSRDAESEAPAAAPPPGSTTDTHFVTVVMPVVQGDRRLGSVYLQTILESSGRRIIRYGLIALLVTMTGLIVGVLGISQRALRRANAELVSRAAELAAANTQLQVQIREREKVEAALRQSQKMEAIGQLTGGVAHDFNNFLQIILSSLDMLRRRGSRWGLGAEADKDFQRFLGAAIQGGERATALTSQLLAFSRRQALEPKPVDANKLVVAMSDLLRRTLGEAIAVESVLAGGLWAIHTDRHQLESALLNLAVNARDAMPNGGKLSIETANAHLDEAYVRSQEDVKAGQYVVVAITDTGTGMTKEVIAQAFEPFFTTKDVGHGTGLGLSQVYGFIKQSGGHIKIYSEPGEGTTVKLYLPRHLQTGEEADGGTPDSTSPVSATSESVLVVEDEDNVRASSVEMLRELGYRVFEAADGHRALRVLEAEPGIELLFTDVGLPGGLNGRQLADEARRRRPDLKVLFTTGYARNAIVHNGRLDPGVELIGKPFTYATLAQKVRDVLRRRT